MGTDSWLACFHAGQRGAMEDCYREHFATVEKTVGQILYGADKETVIHEVFFRLLSDRQARLGFQGGSLRAWIATVARNRAIDYLRRHRREQVVDPEVAAGLAGGEESRCEERTEAKILVERFCREQLPDRLAPVFEARFIKQLSQREAARELGMRRTTLAYREGRIRILLRRFLLRLEER